MCREKAAKQLDLLTPLKDTVIHRIIDMAADVKSTSLEHVKMSRCFSLQLDEFVDPVDLASLLIYIRYEFEGTSHEDFLFCKPLPTGTTGEHIFQLLNEYIEENGIDWIERIGVCTDGARAMTSRHSGVVVQIREVAPDMKWTHCSICREVLAIKKMPEDLKSVRLCCELYQGSNNEFTSALLD
ncbi:SCND3 protein, partial [Atractosteus spatula]|nr:SCND3 protein [Atractosteus spatula]